MSSERKYSLDILRVIATILIVFHHYQQITGSFWEGRLNFYGGKFYFGYIVEFFFLLSGFFMYSYIDKVDTELKFKEFILKKVLRLLPLVLISAVVYEVLLYAYSMLYGEKWMGISVSLWGIVITALGIQDGWTFKNPCVNNPTWYISVLILCYVVFYLVTFISKKRNIPHVYLYAFMCLFGCGIVNYGINLPFINDSSGRGFYPFFFGLILAEILDKRGLKKCDVVASVVSLVFLTGVMLVKFEWVAGGINYIMTFWFYPALIVLFSSKLFTKIFHFRFIGTLGKITYDVYIWHNVNFVLMFTLIGTLHLNVYLKGRKSMLVYTAINFAVGAISYYVLERPINKFITKRWKGKVVKNPGAHPV